MLNSVARTSAMGTSEHTEGSFHEPVNQPIKNNAESVSELAIVAATTTSMPVRTSTGNIRTYEIATNIEVNDETDDETQGEEEEGQSEYMPTQPPCVG